MLYILQNSITNEIIYLNTLQEVADKLGVKYSQQVGKELREKEIWIKGEWKVRREHRRNDEKQLNLVYVIKNIRTNEIFKYKNISEVEKKISERKKTNIIEKLESEGIYRKGKWEVTTELLDVLSRKRTLEGTLASMLEDLTVYDEIMDRREKRKRIYEWKTRESFKDKELLSEIEDARKWREHCKSCCTLSDDEKIYIPNSLIKQIPQLKNYTMPKSMMF